MKKAIFAVIILMTVGTCYLTAGNEKNVPEKVKTAFAQKFKGATDVKWSKEDKNEWEAEFKLNNKSTSANFDVQGMWLETEYAITASEIPANINTQIKKDFPGYKMKESEISETSKGKVYEFEMVKGMDKKEVSYDLNGKQVK